MEDATRDVIARVTATSPNGQVRGTGFLVAPALVATALHNVADRASQVPFEAVHLQFPDHETHAELIDSNRDLDWAILKCQNPPPASRYTPLTLSSLERSGSSWESFGFPNLQWKDGLVLDGEITNHRGKLDNSDAIQLFSKQMVSFDSDARGLSGGPVLTRSGVVGLMRFALGPAGRTAGGVLYACPSRFFSASGATPLSVRAMPKVEQLLSDEQLASLSSLYVTEFGTRSELLDGIVGYALGADLNDIVDPDNTPLEQIIPSLLIWCNRQGLGPIMAYLRATLEAFPESAGLRQFFAGDKKLAAVMQPIDVADLIFQARMTFNTLDTLAGMKPDVRSIVKSFGRELSGILYHLREIDKYKALHNILHDVQFKLEVIESALSAPSSDEKTNEKLLRYAGELEDFAQDAEQEVVGLSSKDNELSWINVLKARAGEMKDVATPEATKEQRGQVYTSLRSQVNQAAPQINRALAEAAGRLRLGGLIYLIDEVISRTEPEEAEARSLLLGADAIGALRANVTGLIKEHSAWQVVSSDLEGAKNSIRHPPQGRIYDWPSFQKRLERLCAIHPNAVWSKRAFRYLDMWIKATPSSVPKDDERKAGQLAFDSFFTACNKRFYDVDGEVKSLSDKVVQLAVPLTALLNTAKTIGEQNS